MNNLYMKIEALMTYFNVLAARFNNDEDTIVKHLVANISEFALDQLHEIELLVDKINDK